MKKIILMVLVFSSAIQYSNAQDEKSSRGRIQIGAKLGVNLSNVYDSKGEDFVANDKLGMAAGAFLSIPLGKLLGVQPEILISQKGFQGTGRILGSTYDYTHTTTFVDIPLFFAIKPVSILTLLVGPQLSFLVHQRDVFVTSTDTYLQEQQFKNDNARKNILGFVLGADINVSHVVVSARAGWDVQNNAADGTSSTPRYKNVYYQGTIGYRF